MEDLHAGVFEAARPANVGGFVEAGFELDDYRHFFFSGGFEQRVRNRRIGIGAIQRLLHGQHARIVAGGAQEIHDGVVGLVRMVEQDVVAAQRFEQRVGDRGRREPGAT